jgi:hypothetical protein
MIKAFEDKGLNLSTGPFERPEGEMKVELDCNKYDKLNSAKRGTDIPEFE